MEPGVARISPARGEQRKDERRPPKTKWPQGRPSAGSRLIRAAALLCAAVSVAVALDNLANAGEIRRGVRVGDVALGGQTPGEAAQTLERSAAGVGEFRLVGEGEAAISARQLGVRVDVGETVRRAYAVGREGGLVERLSDRAGSLFGAGVPAAVGYRPDAAETWVRRVVDRQAADPRDASVRISGSKVSVIPARSGYEPDVTATLENLDGSLESLRGEAEVVGEIERPAVTTREAGAAAKNIREAVAEPLRLTSGPRSWSVPEASISLSLNVERRDGRLRVFVDRDVLGERMARAYGDLTVRPVEAGYEFEGGAVAVTPGRAGLRVEEDRLLDAVENGLFRGVREYELPLAVDRPGLTTAEAERMKPTGVIGSYRTDYAVVEDTGARVENLGISSDAVDGTLLAPGEVFSMNGHVSHLDYNESKVIVGGEETTADGGGLCQVTSTLYNAANFAGLDVLERSPHSSQLPYIRPGMDATVWWGGPGKADDLDMKFRNTTGGYLLLREYVAEDGYVYAEIWGRPDDTEVRMRSKPSYMSAGGSEWVTRQKITRGGEVVFDGVLHRDAYAPLKDQHGNEILPAEVPVAPVNP